MKKIFFSLTLCTLAIVCNAQKIGHLNSGNLLAQMPQVAKADTVLNFYQKDLLSKGDTLAKIFETDYKVFMEAYNAGTLSAVQSQKRQEELQKSQQYLQAYAQDVEQKVTTLRRQLLQPIMGEMEEAIRVVAKENGFTVVFDTSNGSALYAAEGDDITALVKVKLKLK